MPEDYWRELSEKGRLSGKPDIQVALQATFYFGCMVSTMFLGELAAATDEEKSAIFDRWNRDIEVHTEGLMWMWKKERDGS